MKTKFTLFGSFTKTIIIVLLFLCFLIGVEPYRELEYNKALHIKYEVYLTMFSRNNIVTKENLKEHIDVAFISELEGTSLTGYVPKQRGIPLGKSGVTVATGFDLGQRNEQDLRLLGLSAPLIAKLRPYLGKRKWEADNFLRANPLTLTRKEVQEIDEAIFVTKVRGIIRDVGETRWQKMGRSLRTVLASVQFQYGSARLKTPNFFKKVLSMDVPTIATYLKNFGDKYKTRRTRESNYLLMSMKDEKGTKNV